MGIIIREIIRRSEQGVTLPFLCRSTEGDIYFVKGIGGVGIPALRAEVIGGTLASLLRLPIPDFAIVEVSERLIEMSAVDGVIELTGHFAFGSRAIEGAEEISFSQTLALPLEWKAKVLLFDWWIQNEDRILSPLGGNPNMLVSQQLLAQPWLIDHHCAFDTRFDSTAFWKNHIFADSRKIWTKAWRNKEGKRLQKLVDQIHLIWNTLPLPWRSEINEDSSETDLELNRISRILRRPVDAPGEFWNIP
jgi:hypothetical protein